MNSKILLTSLSALITCGPLATAGDPTPAPGKPAAWCRFVPERDDDFAWENDLTTYRAYGPAIVKAKGTENSGIDVWLKRVPYPVLDKWYAADAKQHISYHEDHGEGYDPYHTGASRGCGGTALWQGGKMVLAGPYKEWKIISREPKQCVFELTYDYPGANPAIHEVKRITIGLGQRFFTAESIFTQDGKPAFVDVAVGITTHDGKAVATLNRKQGWMACWEKIDDAGVGTGVFIPPDRVADMLEIKSAKVDESHAVLVTHTDAKGRVVIYAGSCWEKAGGITNSAQWNDYLAQAAGAGAK